MAAVEKTRTEDEDDTAEITLVTAKRQILAKLKLKTTDQEIRTVISKYYPTTDFEGIHKSMYLGCKVAALRKAALFLNYEAQLKADYTKPNLVNWIITRIENFLPETCSTCEKKYCIDFGEKTHLMCFICGQGAHDECFINYIGNKRALPKLQGIHWLCGYCAPRATVTSEIQQNPPATGHSNNHLTDTTPKSSESNITEGTNSNSTINTDQPTGNEQPGAESIKEIESVNYTDTYPSRFKHHQRHSKQNCSNRNQADSTGRKNSNLHPLPAWKM